MKNKPMFFDKTKPNLIFVLGGPGTGKTTQCKLIAKQFNFDHFTIGYFCFTNNSTQSKLQEIFNNQIKLSNQDLCNNVNRILQKTAKNNNVIILEGFVLTENDFDTWENYMKGIIHIVGGLYFHCPEEAMKYRLYNRDEETIQNIDLMIEIINSYKCEDHLIDKLEKHQKLISIETGDSIEKTFQRIVRNLKENNLIQIPITNTDKSGEKGIIYDFLLNSN